MKERNPLGTGFFLVGIVFHAIWACVYLVSALRAGTMALVIGSFSDYKVEAAWYMYLIPMTAELFSAVMCLISVLPMSTQLSNRITGVAILLGSIAQYAALPFGFWLIGFHLVAVFFAVVMLLPVEDKTLAFARPFKNYILE
jgi:hypothetical protein